MVPKVQGEGQTARSLVPRVRWGEEGTHPWDWPRGQLATMTRMPIRQTTTRTAMATANHIAPRAPSLGPADAAWGWWWGLFSP